MLKISIIGNGNLSKALVKEILRKGHKIHQVHALNFLDLKKTYADSPISILENMEELDYEIDILLIAVSDDVIKKVVKNLSNKSIVVLHTSGSVSVDVFEKAGFINYGVFYPLYSFSESREEDFKQIPLMIEYSNSHVQQKINLLGKSIFNRIIEVNSEKRMIYHLSGIFANNFTNHLWSLTQGFIEKNNLDFDNVKPIIMQTAKNAILTNQIADIQTGPASRGNHNVIKGHIKLLEEDKNLLSIYKELSNSILKHNK